MTSQYNPHTIAVQHGSLLCMQIRSKADDRGQSVSYMDDLYVEPTYTVTELKEWLAERFEVPPEEICMEWESSDARGRRPAWMMPDPLNEGARPLHQFLLFGPLSQVKDTDINIFVSRRILTQPQQSLFKYCGYKDWKEMDKVMHLMATIREPGHCFCGNKRDEFPLPPDQSPTDVDDQQFICGDCGHFFDTRYSSISDKGYRPDWCETFDVFEAFQRQALSKARSVHKWMNHDEHQQKMSRNAQKRLPFASQNWKMSVNFKEMIRDVHPGVTIHIVFHAATLQLLKNKDDKEALRKLEVKGASIPHGITRDYIEDWESELWGSEILEKLSIAGHYSDPPVENFVVKYKSYDLEKVVYEARMVSRVQRKGIRFDSRTNF
ncbi:MAG: hypothetical protein SGILL_000545 [Bacillariaceae sp.]